MTAQATAKSATDIDRDLAAAGIGLLVSTTEVAKAAETMLRRRYKWAPSEDADMLVAIGGDGFMLQTLHEMLEGGIPAAGVRDEPRHRRLPDERLADRPARRAHRRRPRRSSVAPLNMTATTVSGRVMTHAAINEVSLLRETRQTAKIEVSVNGRVGDARTGLRRRAGGDPGGLDRL